MRPVRVGFDLSAMAAGVLLAVGLLASTLVGSTLTSRVVDGVARQVVVRVDCPGQSAGPGGC